MSVLPCNQANHHCENSASCNAADQPLPAHDSDTMHPGAMPVGRILRDA